MKRLIDNKLISWKNSERRKPLVIRGARQVGKTYSVRQFAKDHFANQIQIVDFEKNPQWRRVFDGSLDPSYLLMELELLLGSRISPGETLLFIDEIQACPRALTALRYFYEECPQLHVVVAGSLLEFAMRDVSIPVGRLQYLNMYPMNFLEYLWAIHDEPAATLLSEPPRQLSQTVHESLLKELKRYFFIGGMPESIAAYTATSSLSESFMVHKEICNTYRQDFSKYAPYADKQCIDTVFSSLARSVGCQIKYSRLADGYANPTIKKAFELLCLAQVVHKIPSANPSGCPLGASASGKVFKALMLDIGIMHCLCGLSVDTEFMKTDLLSIYRGQMAEQFVGQELLAAQENELFYWSRSARSSTAEVDYLSVIDGLIYPIEVKSGAAGRLRSLHLLLDTYKNCPNGYVFSSCAYSEMSAQKLIFLPLYHVWSITHDSRKMD